MTNSNHESRFDGLSHRITFNGRVLPLDAGLFPEDFPDRLRRLKEASGLTWAAFAQAIGVDRKQLRRWLKKGVEPSGGTHDVPALLRGPHSRRRANPHG